MGSNIEVDGGALPETLRAMSPPRRIEYVRARLESAYSKAAYWEDTLVQLMGEPVPPQPDRPRRDWIDEAVTLRHEGLSYREISDRVPAAPSYEAIRRALLRRGVAGGRNPVKRAQREAELQRRLYRRFAEQAADAEPCVVCGYWVLRMARRTAGHRTCSEECAQAWLLFRLHLDPVQWTRHRELVARRALETTDDEIRVRHAERVFAGTVQSRGGWITSEEKVRFLLRCSGEVRRALEKRLPAPSGPLRERLGVA